MELNQMTKKESKPVNPSGAHLLPEGISLTCLKEWFDMARQEYARPRRRMQVLDAADSGRIWEGINAQFPSYQITPDTNHVNYVKDNILSSIYVVGKFAHLMPRSQADLDHIQKINSILESLWDTLGVRMYQMLAGERASLVNLGITQVGWRKSTVGGTRGNLYKGDAVLKNIDPMSFYRDPYADHIDNGRFTVQFERYHITALKSMDIYKQRLTEIAAATDDTYANTATMENYEYKNDRAKTDPVGNKYHELKIWHVKLNNNSSDGYSICEIHVLNDSFVLFVKQDIKPNMFPYALLYCNIPGKDMVGVSEPAKILANSIAYNLLNSIIATQAYKSQRPPRFVTQGSGINLRMFAKYGADADKLWVVNGDASKAVHYGQFPALPPDLYVLRNGLAIDMKDSSGIDNTYTGKDLGSVTTTGGTDNILSRATSRDNPKIALYEDYTRRLTVLLASNYIEFGDKRSYTTKDKMGNAITETEVDFPKIPSNIKFGTAINIDSELPKNKARIAAAANMLLEKQAQYRSKPAIITNEEWLLMQDIPFKDLIFERLKLERSANKTEQVAQTLFQFSDLIQRGMDPEQAMNQVISTLETQEQPQGTLGNVAEAGSIQARQQG